MALLVDLAADIAQDASAADFPALEFNTYLAEYFLFSYAASYRIILAVSLLFGPNGGTPVNEYTKSAFSSQLRKTLNEKCTCLSGTTNTM